VEVTSSPDQFKQAMDGARARGELVGLVPTMGDLHEGHALLIRTAQDACGFVAVSIFVNPLQFGSRADLDAYPRRLDMDRAMASALGADVLFAPGEAEMYPDGGPQVTVDPGPLGGRLEGASRPSHFRGVLTVVAKLFALAGPCRAYFGEKDAQQLALVRRMVHDLNIPVEVVACPTVRAADGLAVSSRNARLSSRDRAAACVLFDSLSTAAALVRRGERRSDLLKAEMARRIGAEPLARLDYVAVVDEERWEERSVIESPSRALVAARFGETRLIDNLLLPWPGEGSMQNSDVSSRSGR
jgi:pantoate--beta-alanine ligase